MYYDQRIERLIKETKSLLYQFGRARKTLLCKLLEISAKRGIYNNDLSPRIRREVTALIEEIRDKVR